MAKMIELVEAVKDYAIEHYDDGGWDVIVECFDDEKIAECLRKDDALGWGRISTPGAAIKRMRCSFVSIYSDQQADARNSAF